MNDLASLRWKLILNRLTRLPDQEQDTVMRIFEQRILEKEHFLQRNLNDIEASTLLETVIAQKKSYTPENSYSNTRSVPDSPKHLYIVITCLVLLFSVPTVLLVKTVLDSATSSEEKVRQFHHYRDKSPNPFNNMQPVDLTSLQKASIYSSQQ